MTPLAVVLAALAMQAPDEADRVRALVDGVRRLEPLACELVLRGLDVQWDRRAPPDADSAVFALTRWAGVRRVGDAATVPVLTRSMDDPDPCVARLAVRLLGRARVAAAREALVRRLDASGARGRAQAAIGLGYAGEARDVLRLVALLTDPAPAVREAAAWALGALH